MPDTGAKAGDGWLVHIGYAKAASTLLQTTLFSGQHPGFAPLGSSGKGGLLTVGTGRTRHVPAFGAHLDDARAEIAAHPPQPGRVTVLSNEEYAGHPFSGGVTAPLLADRLHTLLPNARVLIVVREQRAMCLSAYAHYLTRVSGTASLDFFLNPELLMQLPFHHPDYYAFSHLVRWYVEAFGRDRVLVLPMEAVTRDLASCARRIEQFAGVAHAPIPDATSRANRRDYAEYAVLRRVRALNRLGRPNPSNGYSGRGIMGLRVALLELAKRVQSQASIDRRLTRDRARIEAALAPTITEDNVRLQSYMDDDLAALGYMMPDTIPDTPQS